MTATGLRRGSRLGVLVADDDARVRNGLRALIDFAPDAVVIGEASSATAALQLDLALRPDVVVLDLLLPEAEDGLGVLRELRARGRPVVAISVWGTLGPRALATGAASFLEKGSHLIDQLVAAIRSAATGSST